MNPPGESVTCDLLTQDDLDRRDAFGLTENGLPVVENDYQVSLTETPSGELTCRVLGK